MRGGEGGGGGEMSGRGLWEGIKTGVHEEEAGEGKGVVEKHKRLPCIIFVDGRAWVAM